MQLMGLSSEFGECYATRLAGSCSSCTTGHVCVMPTWQCNLATWSVLLSASNDTLMNRRCGLAAGLVGQPQHLPLPHQHQSPAQESQ